MSAEQFANNASTTLGSAVGSGTTTITVATGTGANFPSPSGGQYFTATLWAAGSTTGVPNEIVRVTARTGDTMTVVRGQEGTTAQAWNVGDTFANYPTAAFYNALTTDQNIQLQSGNSAVDSGTANAGAITLNPAITSLSQILYAPLRVLKMASANTGAYTLNVNGIGPQAVKVAGVAMSAGQLPGSLIYEVSWDGTQFELISPPALVTNAELFSMPTNTVKANITGAGAQPSDVTLPDLLAALGAGGGSLTTQGWLSIPLVISGVLKTAIVQWGSLAVSNGTFSFPVTFPNACFQVFVTNTTSQGTEVDNAFGYVVSRSQFFAATKSSNNSGVTNYPVNWWAIGW